MNVFHIISHYSHWRATPDNNVEVLNDTADYYRYFEATAYAEFLYSCVEQTVKHDLPEEVEFLTSFSRPRESPPVPCIPHKVVEIFWRRLTQGR